ncbi:MAG TPA: hypothetical protein VE641_17490 [Chthoniobacterales bacterium]|nr:hypothetical protein [Chthoniobacterales bacterium]
MKESTHLSATRKPLLFAALPAPPARLCLSGIDHVMVARHEMPWFPGVSGAVCVDGVVSHA